MSKPLATRILLGCGILAPFVFIGTDLLAGALYPGYRFASQAVSELFAIGAPTSGLVVALFSVGSVLLLGFAAGVWGEAGGSRALRFLAVMFAVNAIDGLVLWNMRGEPRTFTDTMHLVLAVNPAVLLSLVAVMVAFRNWLRAYTVVTAALLVGIAGAAFSYAPDLAANAPTPWLGLTERASQWSYHIWQVVLTIVLWRRQVSSSAARAPASLQRSTWGTRVPS